LANLCKTGVKDINLFVLTLSRLHVKTCFFYF